MSLLSRYLLDLTTVSFQLFMVELSHQGSQVSCFTFSVIGRLGDRVNKKNDPVRSPSCGTEHKSAWSGDARQRPSVIEIGG